MDLQAALVRLSHDAHRRRVHHHLALLSLSVTLGGFALEVGGDSGADAVADAAYGALDAADGSALLHAEDVSDADEAEVVVGDTVAVVHARLVLP